MWTKPLFLLRDRKANGFIMDGQFKTSNDDIIILDNIHDFELEQLFSISFKRCYGLIFSLTVLAFVLCNSQLYFHLQITLSFVLA